MGLQVAGWEALLAAAPAASEANQFCEFTCSACGAAAALPVKAIQVVGKQWPVPGNRGRCRPAPPTQPSPRPLALPQCLFICGVELLFEVNHFFLKVSTAETGAAHPGANAGHAHAATCFAHCRLMARPAALDAAPRS